MAVTVPACHWRRGGTSPFIVERVQASVKRCGFIDNSGVRDCCSPKGYRWIFSERQAQADARRYRRRGLDAVSRRIVELVKREPLQGRTVLEVGGGIGGIQIELLRAGAASAVSIELTATYETAARALLREAGVEDRVERKVMDFAAANGAVPAADIVILNRVICCYPDMARLTSAAADHTRQMLVMSFPRERWWTRLGLSAVNAILRLTRREFQVFLHSPAGILATAEQRGLKTTSNKTGFLWQIVALERGQAFA
jgi:2-polyprenyl-3-methyl-5-hydroxy-6-metoxy-1,4-benzoquinol methylase